MNRYGSEAYTDGYSVYTTVNANRQRAANKALRNALLGYDRRHGYRGHLGFYDLNTESETKVKEKLLQAIEVFGGNVVYDGWEDPKKREHFMNVDVDIIKGRDGNKLKEFKRFRVSLHKKDSYKKNVEKLRLQRQEIGEYMKSISLKSLPGNTTFYFFTSIKDSKLNSDEFSSTLLKNYHVSTVPGIGYGKSCNKFIRISVGSENMERIKIGLNAIKNLISKTSN